MKKLERLLVMIFITVSSFSLSSCKSEEGSYIKRLEALCDEVEADDKVDDEKINKYFSEFSIFQNEYDKYKFSDEQEEEIGKLSQRFFTVIASKRETEVSESIEEVEESTEEVEEYMEIIQ